MRLSAYKKAVDYAAKLPQSIPILDEYFRDFYSPRETAINHILHQARADFDGLLGSEYAELRGYAKERI
jgi:hypothetical protein